MRTLKVLVLEGKPQWSTADWDQGCPHYFTDNFSPVEVCFVKEGLTIGLKKFLWVSEDVRRVKDNKFRYERLGYMPSSSIGGIDRGQPWVLLEVDQLGKLFKSALREVNAAHSSQEASAREAQLKEELGEAMDDRDHCRAEYWRLNRQYEQMQGYLGELLSDK